MSILAFSRIAAAAIILAAGNYSVRGHEISEGVEDELTPPMAAYLLDLEQFGKLFGANGVSIRGVLDSMKQWPRGSVLEVCFIDPDRSLRAIFADASTKWVQGTSLRLDFGAPPGFRDCNPAAPSKIRVAFRKNQKSWSYIGNDSEKMDDDGASLNIQVRSSNRASIEASVLHELGHALGLVHEHQSPKAKCSDELKWDEIFRRYSSLPQAQVKAMFETLAGDAERWRTTAYDKTSIMHYFIPEALFSRGDQARCFAGHNIVLSSLDQQFIREVYGSPGSVADAFGHMRASADVAGRAFARMNLAPQQVARLGQEVANVVKSAGRNVTLKFNLDNGATRRALGDDSVVPCAKYPLANKQVPGTKCEVAGDGSSFVVSTD